MANNINIKEIGRLAASIIIVFIAGAIGTVATLSEITTWYAALAKPVWAPPNWLFGPVWTTLYVLIGIALFLVWKEGTDRRDVRIALVIFAVQLILNITWSVVFFGYHSLLGGFIVILILWMAILANILAFYLVSKPAGLILIPYIVWVSIASYLNYAVYILNP